MLSHKFKSSIKLFLQLQSSVCWYYNFDFCVIAWKLITGMQCALQNLLTQYFRGQFEYVPNNKQITRTQALFDFKHRYSLRFQVRLYLIPSVSYSTLFVIFACSVFLIICFSTTSISNAMSGRPHEDTFHAFRCRT